MRDHKSSDAVKSVDVAVGVGGAASASGQEALHAEVKRLLLTPWRDRGLTQVDDLIRALDAALLAAPAAPLAAREGEQPCPDCGKVVTHRCGAWCSWPENLADAAHPQPSRDAEPPTAWEDTDDETGRPFAASSDIVPLATTPASAAHPSFTEVAATGKRHVWPDGSVSPEREPCPLGNCPNRDVCSKPCARRLPHEVRPGARDDARHARVLALEEAAKVCESYYWPTECAAAIRRLAEQEPPS